MTERTESRSYSAARVDYAERVGIYLSWVPPAHAKDAREALDGLVVERQRAIDALREIAESYPSTRYHGSETYFDGFDRRTNRRIAREALDV